MDKEAIASSCASLHMHRSHAALKQPVCDGAHGGRKRIELIGHRILQTHLWKMGLNSVEEIHEVLVPSGRLRCSKISDEPGV